MKIYLSFLIILISLIGCGLDNKKSSDLGIVQGKIETYFYSDTSYSDQKINYSIKYNRDSLYYKPYSMGIEYGKEYNEKNATWKLNFSPSHYDKYVSVYPSKGKLIIDNFELTYESVMTSELGVEKNTLFIYGTFDKISTSDLLNKIANSKEVKFVAIGHDKKEFIWSPKIIEDAKNTLKYFEILNKTSPKIN